MIRFAKFAVVGLSVLISLEAAQAKPAVSARLNPDGDPRALAARVEGDLNEGLARLLPDGSYLLHVFPRIESMTERRVIESETLSAQPGMPAAAPKAPPVEALPGFIPPPPSKSDPTETGAVPATQTRQVYRNVEREVLRSLSVEANLDRGLTAEQATAAESLVRQYLKSGYGGVASVKFHRVPMASATAPKSWVERPETAAIAWGLGAFFAASLLGFALMRLLFRKDRAQNDFSRGASKPVPAAEPAARVQSNPSSDTDVSSLREDFFALAMKSGAAFVGFVERLGSEDRFSVYALLASPAGHCMAETLGIALPKSTASASQVQATALRPLIRELRAFVDARAWREARFFGFASNRSIGELAWLASHETPLASATLLAQLAPGEAADLLEALDPSLRARVLAASAEASRLSVADLRETEARLRSAMALIPSGRAAVINRTDESARWEEILDRATSDDSTGSLLEELRAARPDLAAGLERRAFSLGDAALQGGSAVAQVLESQSNEELALALFDCASETRNTLLARMAEARRSLIEGELRALRAEVQAAPDRKAIAGERARARRRLLDRIQAHSAIHSFGHSSVTETNPHGA